MSGNQKKKKRKEPQSFSGLSQHTQSGKTLTPPMATLPNLTRTSWMDDRMPELLWAVLIVTHIERTKALEILRAVGRAGIDCRAIGKIPISLSGIASMPSDIRDAIISMITEDSSARTILKSLTFFDHLPARDAWIAKLGEPVLPLDWALLMNAVSRTLDHQSQESTDCQWVSLYFRVASNQYLPADVRTVAEYPSVGDQRSVRPSVRSTEMSLDLFNRVQTGWSQAFWDQCLRDTPCIFPEGRHCKSSTEEPIDLETWEAVVGGLAGHAKLNLSTTKVDPKYDMVFGAGFYVLGVLGELIGSSTGDTIVARMALRAVFESYATLAYLRKKNEESLWKSYRVYGAGQAKLAFLKTVDMDERPAFISIETLRHLANEDQWEEFLSIDLGHWDKSNLRSMSEVAGVKEDYDRYYSWTSAFTHGHWGALRSAVFATCLNPLHRLHRIPTLQPLENVIPDVILLVDKILGIVGELYPTFQIRLS
jgi:Family of unknown function (DUF5677)